MVRYAVIGLGSVGRLHLNWAARHPDVTIVGVADMDAGRASAEAAPHGAPAFSDHRRMLDETTPDIVSLAAPTGVLASIASDCLRAGAHVLIEKPLARHVGEARALIALASEQQRRLGVVYQYRTFDTPRTIHALLTSGAIGELSQIIWSWHQLRTEAYYRRAAWLGDWAGAGGGLVTNQLIHDLDLLRWLGGEVASVQAHLSGDVHASAVDDSLSATLRFASGAVATLSASLNHAHVPNVRQLLGTAGALVVPDARPLDRNPCDTMQLARYATAMPDAIRSLPGGHDQPDAEWRTVLSRPVPMHARLPGWLRRTGRFVLRHRPPANARPASGHGALVWDFVDAIVRGEPLPVGLSAENALRTLELANALTLASLERREIALPLDADAYQAAFETLASGERRL